MNTLELLKQYSQEITHHDYLFLSVESLIDSHRKHRQRIRELEKEIMELRTTAIDQIVMEQAERLIKHRYLCLNDLKNMTLLEIAELIIE